MMLLLMTIEILEVQSFERLQVPERTKPGSMPTVAIVSRNKIGASWRVHLKSVRIMSKNGNGGGSSVDVVDGEYCR
jgi:hypothetical protein